MLGKHVFIRGLGGLLGLVCCYKEAVRCAVGKFVSVFIDLREQLKARRLSPGETLMVWVR